MDYKDIPVADIISHYLPLAVAGGYRIGFCPFEKHTSPRTPGREAKALAVSATQNTWYCFGCKIGGDGVAFIMHKELCLKNDAIRILRERYKDKLISL